MEAEDFRRFIDACYEARHVIDLLPALPSELTRSNMKVLNAIAELQCTTGEKPGVAGIVRVSDVAAVLKTPRPVVTRALGELERRGDVRKVPSEKDRRVIFVELTEQGLATHQAWVTDVHGHIAALLDDAGVKKDDIDTAIRTVSRVRAEMEAADLQRWQTNRLA